MTRSHSTKVAVVGSGIAGMSCAWLLNQACDVTLFEADDRLGGHTHTVEALGQAVDTGFIVFNEENYPNLTALFSHLGVQTQATDMSFGVSLDDGALEYGSVKPLSLFAQPSNVFRPRFWSMLSDLVRFYRCAPAALASAETQSLTLGELLKRGGYSRAFQEDHLLPQVGAIWSTSAAGARDYPAEALIRFFNNHGLLKLINRPLWRTVVGGSKAYIARLTGDLNVKRNWPVEKVQRTSEGVVLHAKSGETERFDEVVIAAHADQALKMLSNPTRGEQDVLSAFAYSRNEAVLHWDRALMPKRRPAWSAWNHIGRRGDLEGFCVTYWMNLLQNLTSEQDFFVTLNPCRPIDPAKVLGRFIYEHPLFDSAALAAQKKLWPLQGADRVWFCGAYFGAGFHEDGLQAGLLVAEQLGGAMRPWSVANPSGRIYAEPSAPPTLEAA